MEKNVGLVDRYIRLASGVVMLAAGSGMRRNPLAKSALLSMGAMKLAEGITGWCPVMYACGIRSIQSPEQQQSADSSSAKVSGRSEMASRRDESVSNTSNWDEARRNHAPSDEDSHPLSEAYQ